MRTLLPKRAQNVPLPKLTFISQKQPHSPGSLSCIPWCGLTTCFYGGFLIAPRERVEWALLDWISVNSRLCAVWFAGFIHGNNSPCKISWLFVLSMYATDDWSYTEEKKSFIEISSLLRDVRSTEVWVVAGDFNVQLGCSAKT